MGSQPQVRRILGRLSFILMPKNTFLAFLSRQFSSTHQETESGKQEDPQGKGPFLRKALETLSMVPQKIPV